MPAGKSLFLSLRRLLESRDWKEIATEVGTLLFTSVVQPVGWAMLSLFLGLKCYLWLRRNYISPPTPEDYHREALLLYQQESLATKPNFGPVEKLLQKATKMGENDCHHSCCYEPAQLSLAALYLYQLENPQKALQVLESCTSTTSTSTSTLSARQAMRMDAQAMQQGQGNMIPKELMRDEYLSRFATTTTTTATATATTTVPSTETKPSKEEESKKKR